MRRIAKEDIRYKSYTLKIRQMLSETARTSRVARCNLLLYSLKNEASEPIRFFSDEKMFTVDIKINRRNDRWLAYNPADVPVVAKTKFPVNFHARRCVQ